mmetsp:Transcript_44540/g.123551  ORF Transcript_44540/g.123551 Transcript_44540/m.123551 type:complete len:360 (+) Transcript_44540:824-1903(+)
MSERIRRSGTSSALSLALSAATRMRSHAASKLVEPPHGAACSFSTFSRMVVQPERSTQRGSDSKVSTRCRNASHASSDTSAPRPMAASIGRPVMLPLTSTSATSRPRSTPFVCAPARLASCWATPSRIDAHCASISSPSAAESSPCRSKSRSSPRAARHMAWSRASTTLATISCGCSTRPLTPFFLSLSAARRCWRAATRAASFGWRLPVSICARLSAAPLSRSLRKALRKRCRQSDATWANWISAHWPAAIFTSVVLSAALSRESRRRYLRRAACLFAAPKRRAASLDASPSFLSKHECSRGAHLPASESLGVRPSEAAAVSSRSSAFRASATSERQRSAIGAGGSSAQTASKSRQYP